MNFKSKIKPKNPVGDQLFEVHERVLEGFKSGIFEINQTEGTVFSYFDPSHLKILAPKQMLQRLSIALAQVKADNISEIY